MVSAAAWDALDQLCGAVLENGQSLGWFQKHMREIASAYGWTAWGDRADCDRRARVVYKAILSIEHAHRRLQQLRSGAFTIWVYRHGAGLECPDDHEALDGIALPVGHEFWDIWTPPTAYGCACYVVGASSERGAARLGAVAGKALPDWWDDPTRGPHPYFIGFGKPGLHQIVQAALRDEVI